MTTDTGKSPQDDRPHEHVSCAEGRVTEYQVNMMVTFVLDD